MPSETQVLVVDDSPTMQAILKQRLEEDPNIRVAGLAANPLAAREAIKALKPDVVTLDINMPGMDGLEFLARVMKLHPMPVVIVSSLVGKNSGVALDALALGAFDCFLKPSTGNDTAAYDELRQKVRVAATSPIAGAFRRQSTQARAVAYTPNDSIVAIGASTGGVDALLQILETYPENCPPTVITQHMPRSFTKSFADRLNGNCHATVKEATNGAQIKSGFVYLAPGGETHLEVTGRSQPLCRLRVGDPISGHRPSIDVLFRSIARRGSGAVGVLLTGMGDDGARGLLEMRNAGASTLGQDKASCLVYGMPRVAFDIGAVEKQVPLSKIGPEVLRLTEKTKRL